MTAKYEKLKTLLKELFQLDQPDLDFGLYRIMHAISREVTNFLDENLLPQVKQAFSEYKTADKAEIEKELMKAIEQAQSLGAEPETLPKVKALREKLAKEAVDIDALESEVYDHLFRFFRRYYSEGDFLAKPVYKSGVYAIPYEGEEVVLHWANKDQYYIKTSEYLRDYVFRLRPEDEQNPMRVHFRLSDVAEGEHGNVKPAKGKDRLLVLCSDGPSGSNFMSEEDGKYGKELVIRFEYRAVTVNDWPDNERDNKTKPPTQKELTTLAVKRVFAITESSFVGWINELAKPHILSGDQTGVNSRLEVHLKRFSARNTFDYFIHKELGKFLRRELDFYIKNEIMHLDDIEGETAPRVDQYLSKIKIVRKIAGKIIDFLAQLENFQKKLWTKRKFVVETQYCIALRVIPDEFYSEIVANNAQRCEWLNLLSFDDNGLNVTPSNSGTKINIEALKANPTLMIDTRHFDAGFTARLLETLGDLDERTDGVLFHAENAQALSLMRARYQGCVECIHIDPPYNTQTSGFLYKNSYQHSSWLAMMAERIEAARTLMNSNGTLLCHIDENEYERLHVMCEELRLPNAGTVIWDKRNPMLGRKGVATQHEYVLWRTQVKGPVYLRNASQRLILENANQIIALCGGVTDEARERFAKWVTTHPDLTGGEQAYRLLEDDGRVYRGVAMGAPEPRTDPKFHIPLIHPITKKACPVPPNGWSRTPETLADLTVRKEILWGEDESVQPQRKVFLTQDSQRQVPSVIKDAGRGKADMDNMGLEFPYSHPLSLYVELIGAAAPSSEAILLDFFAGSGTNGHAVIELNRDEGTHRKLILVEVGEQFDTVLLPRLKKATFARMWKKGKPERFSSSEEAERGPRIMKVIRLESYEDTLNNLETKRTENQQLMLDSSAAKGADGFREEYLLHYMLNVETQGSQSLLNVQSFSDPTAYKLKIKCFGSDESNEINVDLLETFNWLIGLKVKHIGAPQTFSAEFELDTEKRLRILSNSQLKPNADGPFWFRRVTGTMPDGRRALVIWRRLTGTPEQDNLVLDEWFSRESLVSTDTQFDLIYVNGTNNLENLKTSDTLWKVRLIEEDFHRLMFEGRAK